MTTRICKLLTVLLLLISTSIPSRAAEPDYPRIMGVAIAGPLKYDEPDRIKRYSKVDVLILNFWPRWKDERYGAYGIQTLTRQIKALNPDIKIGQYTVLNEAKAADHPDITSRDIANKLDQEKWWLRGPSGNRVQHTAQYGAWDINFTKFTKPDKKNKRFPEWLAERNYQLFFKENPELDFWFMDISVPQAPVAFADWTNSGVPQLSSLSPYAKAYRDGHVAYWNTIKTLQPNKLLIGNAPDLSSTEYKSQLNGTLLEAAMGLKWSLYDRKGWEALRQQYYELMADTKPPKLVGLNVWGAANDYQKMRFGLTTCLLNNGYFSYTDNVKQYSEIPWFDEFDADLGKPTENPPTTAWKNGVYKRSFENGLVLVNPTNNVVHVVLDKQYKRLSGTQARNINSGQVTQELDLAPRDGIILSSDHSAPAPPPIQNITPIR